MMYYKTSIENVCILFNILRLEALSTFVVPG